MAFIIHSLDQFRKLRKEAKSWRMYESALSSVEPNEAEIIRGVLMAPPIDGRSDPDYEKRLYDAFKEAMSRTKAGQPLSDTPPSTARPKPSYQERILQAGRELGYLSEPEEPEVPLSPAVSWAQSTPSPSPPSTPPCHNFSPTSSAPTSPPTPIVPPLRKPRQPTITSLRLGLKARKRTTPTKRHNYPSKRRAHQLKFDDTVLAEVRHTPPLTRARLRKEVVSRLTMEIAEDTV